MNNQPAAKISAISNTISNVFSQLIGSTKYLENIRTALAAWKDMDSIYHSVVDIADNMTHMLRPYAEKIKNFDAHIQDIIDSKLSNLSEITRGGQDITTDAAAHDTENDTGSNAIKTNTYAYPEGLLTQPDTSYIRTTTDETETPGTTHHTDHGERKRTFAAGTNERKIDMDAQKYFDIINDYSAKISGLINSAIVSLIDPFSFFSEVNCNEECETF